MFKKIINLLILITLMSSCTNNGKQVETNKAKIPNIINTSTSTSYNKVKEGSFVSWRATHLGGINPRFGKVYCKDARVLVNNGKLRNASIVMDMSKITVEDLPEDDANELRTHLLSADFFDIKKYPISSFELTHLETIQGKYNSKITANLTILGVSKSINFKANINVLENELSVISEEFKINRSDWGLTYHAKGTAGVPLDYLISDDIKFAINVTILK